MVQVVLLGSMEQLRMVELEVLEVLEGQAVLKT